MRNNALAIERPNEIVCRDIGVRELAPGCARVAVKAIGICGSDINYFKGAAQTKIPYPLVIGHEVSGEVVEVRGADGGPFDEGAATVAHMAAHPEENIKVMTVL